CHLLCHYCSADHRDLHSFPTRRSSDLVPTICTRIPEFIEAGGLGPVYVRPGNIDEAADTIQNLLHNPSLLSNMIEQGSIHAQNFDNFRVAQQLNELYYSLLDKKQNLAKA